MAITFKSAGHEFAAAFTRIKDGAEAVERVIAKIDTPAVQAEVTTVAAALLGPGSADLIRVGFALLGEFGQILSSGDAAAEAKLTNAGLDVAVIGQVKTLLATAKPQLLAAGVKL